MGHAIWHSSSYNYTGHALPQVAAAVVVMVWVTAVLVRERASRVSVLLFVLALGASCGYLSAAFSFSAVDAAVSTFWTRTGFTGLSLIPGAVFHFTMSVLLLEDRRRPLIWLMWGVSALFAPLPHATEVMIPGVVRHWWGTTAELSWLNVALLGLIFGTTLVCLWHLRLHYLQAEPGSMHRARVKAYLLSISVGVLSLVDFVAETGLELYPVGFVFMALFVLLAAHATWRHRLVDLTPAFAAPEVLRTMQGAVLVTDQDDRITLVNRGACAMLRCEEDDLLRMKISEVLTFGDSRSSRATQDYRICWRALDGHLVDVSVSASPLKDGSGRLVGTVYAALDISALRAARDELNQLNSSLEDRVARRTAALARETADLEQELAERRRAEEALRKAYDELRSTQRQLVQSEKMAAIGQLAAGVAHEINNPAGFVLSNLETMKEYTESVMEELRVRQRLCRAAASGQPGARDALVEHLTEAAASEEAQLIRDDFPDVTAETIVGADRIREIVSNLGAYARPGEEIPRPVDLNRELERALSLTHNELKYTCEVVRDLEQDLPLVPGHAGELGQVFVNLLVNASHAVSGRGRVEVRTRRRDEQVAVEVSDDGDGMPAQVRHQIFEPFFTTKKVGQGTGLGLSIAHGIIQRHGGTIRVDSAEGVGTTFSVSLPIQPGVDHGA